MAPIYLAWLQTKSRKLFYADRHLVVEFLGCLEERWRQARQAPRAAIGGLHWFLVAEALHSWTSEILWQTRGLVSCYRLPCPYFDSVARREEQQGRFLHTRGPQSEPRRRRAGDLGLDAAHS
jgi:hypothetical protein